MKNLALGLFILTVLLSGARVVSYLAVKPNYVDKWTTFQKHPHHPNLVRSHASTLDERKKANIKPETETKALRSPAQVDQSKASPVTEKIKFDGREIFNLLAQDQQLNAELTAINTPSDEWQSLAAGKLLRFQNPETKLFLMPEKSMVKIEENGARYVEVVQIKFLMNDGKKSSYSALIDSQSGEMLRTWNQSIQDTSLAHKNKFKMLEPGTL